MSNDVFGATVILMAVASTSSPECAQEILHGNDAEALGMQQGNHFAPARPVSPGAADDQWFELTRTVT